MKIHTDRDACVGAGQCVAIASDVFDLADDGKVAVLHEYPAEELREQIRRAVFACPAFAISIDEP